MQAKGKKGCRRYTSARRKAERIQLPTEGAATVNSKQDHTSKDAFVPVAIATCPTCGAHITFGVTERQLAVWLSLTCRQPGDTPDDAGYRHHGQLVALFERTPARHHCGAAVWSLHNLN